MGDVRKLPLLASVGSDSVRAHDFPRLVRTFATLEMHRR
jgi:hypothetical protein